jgi:3-dehydroquinate dehydratase/shikimate dehydrogenase
MICVCIGRGRHKHMMAEHRYLAEQNVKLVELRVDFIRSRLDIKRLLMDRPCPCIVTCRREQDGGHWDDSEESRLRVLRTAIVEGADYVDLEEDVAGQIPRYGKTKRIVSYHNFRDTPDELYEIHKRLASLDADIVKIATLTHRPSDNLRMLRLIRESEIPTIGICMGEIGVPTRILAGKFGAPFTYATFHHERKLAPGQISYTQMRDIYRYEEINADTEVYGVIADPVSQSMSPLVINVGFGHHGLNKVFVPFRIPRDELAEFMRECWELEIKGLSVGIPHKEEMLRHLSKADGVVRGIGAANTVLLEGRETVGFNTDYRGFLDGLDGVFHESERGMSLAGRSALILGAGGISKAIAYGLKRRDADIIVSSRTYERSLLFAEKFRCRTVQWYERMKVEPEILINATPVGMHPNVDETPMDPKYLRRGMIVVDTVSNPEQTLLVKQAREQNCRVVTGIDIFISQAALQYEHFTGQKAPIDLMGTTLRRAIGPAQWQD